MYFYVNSFHCILDTSILPYNTLCLPYPGYLQFIFCLLYPGYLQFIFCLPYPGYLQFIFCLLYPGYIHFLNTVSWNLDIYLFCILYPGYTFSVYFILYVYIFCSLYPGCIHFLLTVSWAGNFWMVDIGIKTWSTLFLNLEITYCLFSSCY